MAGTLLMKALMNTKISFSSIRCYSFLRGLERLLMTFSSYIGSLMSPIVVWMNVQSWLKSFYLFWIKSYYVLDVHAFHGSCTPTDAINQIKQLLSGEDRSPSYKSTSQTLNTATHEIIHRNNQFMIGISFWKLELELPWKSCIPQGKATWC